MALRFDMGNQQSMMQALLAQQQSNMASQIGQDVGSAIGGIGKWYSENKSKVGKAYQKYLTDKSNFHQNETILSADGNEIANPNYGQWKGPMKTFGQFKNDFRSDKRANRTIKNLFTTEGGDLNISGVDKAEYGQILRNKYRNKVIKSKKDIEFRGGEKYNPEIPLTKADYDAVMTKSEKKGILQDYLQTESGQDLVKSKRQEKRQDFFQNIGDNVKNIGDNVKETLPYLGKAAMTAGAVANPALAATLGSMYGFSKLPRADERAMMSGKGQDDGFDTVDDQLSDKQRMIQTLNLEKTPGAKGFFQRFLPGGDPGYRAKEGKLPVTKQSAASKEAQNAFMSMGNKNNQIVNALTNNILGNSNQTVGFGQYGNMNPFLPDIPKPDGTGGVFDDFLYKDREETNARLGQFYPTTNRQKVYGLGGRNIKVQI